MSEDYIAILTLIAPYALFILGALLGSFANVVISRLPNGESVVMPRSHCPNCKTPIPATLNIPLVSWLWLRGKCKFCQAPIPARYFAVELLTGFLFATAWYAIGPHYFLIEALIFLFSLVICSFIDLDHYILPDVFTLSGIAIGLLGALINPERSFADAIIGVLLGGGFLWALAYLYLVFRKQEGMGGGDIKLLAWIGAVLGWKSIAFVIIASSLVGSVFGLWSAMKSKNGMKTIIPFGPFLALGAALWIFGGEILGLWYLKLFLPFLENP